MQCRSLQKAVFKTGSRVFARDDKEGTTAQAIHTSSGRINSAACVTVGVAPRVTYHMTQRSLKPQIQMIFKEYF
jgi:hypothetical protein